MMGVFGRYTPSLLSWDYCKLVAEHILCLDVFYLFERIFRKNKRGSITKDVTKSDKIKTFKECYMFICLSYLIFRHFHSVIDKYLLGNPSIETCGH